jgi:hypothetical protein|tara:strand:+ start:916 stop:1068 length:153 start_codon:yes stop_codon:yes gene_type:complete
LVIEPKAQLAKIFNVDLVLASTPVLRIGNTDFELTQTGAIGLHGELRKRL